MNKIKTTSVFLLITLFFSSSVFAEGKKLKEKLSQGTLTVTAEVKGCDEDAKKFCPGLEPGSQKAFMCLMAYEEKISDICKVGIAEAAMSVKMGLAAIDYSVRACEQDADKYCLDVQPGEGKIVKCLKKHEAKVSQSCVTALKETGLWKMGAK